MNDNRRRDDEAATVHLEALAEALQKRGFKTDIKHPDGRIPSLRVINAAVKELSELVVVDQGVSGDWFLWSWAEKIAPARDVERTAARIAYVLAMDGC